MNSFNMQLDKDFQLLAIKYDDYMNFMNDGVSTEQEKEIILQIKTVDVLNRYGNKHWCDELAAIIERYEMFFNYHSIP